MPVLYFLIILSAVLFFHGFFPVSSPNLNFDNDPPNEIRGEFLNKQELYKSKFTNTILIIIDALRLDFANPNYMPLTSQLVQENGCFNKIKVEIPTVTLPRIKALTAGNIPQFIDLVLNLASTEVLSDSIIHSAVADGKKIIFYGDDTWLKLFPNKFLRFEGTNSFFVRDFTEVDNNVTRNVNIELGKQDWDMMILHYLGLDHIGHIYGPFSSLIPIKLKEMDQIIHHAYKTVFSRNENTLFIVTGDHGMRDSGGHGGSTYSETNVPLLIIGYKCENNTFSQTDIPVNLAVLLGLKIPSVAIGRLQKSMILATSENYLYSLYYNTYLLNQKHSCCEKLFDEANVYYVNYLKHSNKTDADKAIELYESCLETISNNLAKSSIKQNLFFLIIATVTMLNCLVILILELVGLDNKSVILKYTMVLLIFIQLLVKENVLIFLLTIIILSLFLLNNLYTLIKSLTLPKSPNILHFVVFCSILHPITFLSSSYVEEEHQFWYFFNILFIFFQNIRFSKTKQIKDVSFCVSLLAIFRVLRTINSTGDKWSNYPDLSDWFLKEENYIWYQTIFILGLILVLFTQYQVMKFKQLSVIFLNIVVLISIFLYKQNESNTLLGKFIWFLILLNFIVTYNSSKILTWILIVSLLLKPYNIILIPYCVLTSLYFAKFYKKTEILVLYSIFLSNMLYFSQGHSNSLASVDISVGYIGLTSFQPTLVFGQVICHTEAFPVLCHLIIFNNQSIENTKVWKILFCNKLYIFLITCIITFIFRQHLFIWSVFAPKLFIEFVHILFLFLEYLLYNLNKFFLSECKLFRLLKLQSQCLKSKINHI